MRMKISFMLNKQPMSIAYRMGVVSLVKEALKSVNEDYYKKLYESGKKSKPFSFSVKLINFNKDEDKIAAERMEIIFSSPDLEFLMYLHNGLIQIKEFTYKGVTWEKENISLLRNKQIVDDAIICKAYSSSPLHLEDINKKPVSAFSPEFEIQLNYYADMLLKNFRHEGLLLPLKFFPIDMKKTVIKETNSGFDGGKLLTFEGYAGIFGLMGHPYDLQTIYELGVGRRRSQGFGLFDVLEGYQWK